jgi:hypothetical protein
MIFRVRPLVGKNIVVISKTKTVFSRGQRRDNLACPGWREHRKHTPTNVKVRGEGRSYTVYQNNTATQVFLFYTKQDVF